MNGWKVSATLTSKIRSVHPWVRVNDFEKFEEIRLRCSWDIVFMRMEQTDNVRPLATAIAPKRKTTPEIHEDSQILQIGPKAQFVQFKAT